MPEEKQKSFRLSEFDLGETIVFLIVIALLVLGWFGWKTFFGQEKKSPNKPQQSTATTQVADLGAEGKLISKDVETWYFATSSKNFDQLTKTILAKDDTGLADMISNGEVFPVKNGTKLKKIDSNWTGGIEVRVLDGEQSGKSGWIAKELFQ